MKRSEAPIPRRTSTFAWHVGSALAASCFGLGDAAAQANPALDSQPVDRPAEHAAALERARDDYEQGRWKAAYAAFAALADLGDGEAARVAWLMHRHGPALYLAALPATDAQRTRWRLASGLASTGPLSAAPALAPADRSLATEPSRRPNLADANNPRR